jgi:predicted PurR-regulated permease PerM
MGKIALVTTDPVPTHEPVPHVRHSVSLGHLLPAVLIVGTLWWAQAFFIPVVFSVLLSYALEPLVARLRLWHVPRSVAVPFILTALLVGMASGMYALRGQAVAFANRLPQGAHVIAQAVRLHTSGAPGPFAKMQQAAKELEAMTLSRRLLRANDGVTSVRIEEPTFRWSSWLLQGSHGAVLLGGQLFAVICLVYYLMMSGDLYRRKLVRIVGPSIADKKLTVHILADIDRQIERFLLARAVISAAVGVAVWGAFRLLGLEEAGIWAVLSAVLFTIPIVGPAVVIGGAALAGMLQFGSLSMAAAAAGACTVIAAIEGNVLSPWLLSRAGEMNAVAVFVSLLFWGWLWGAWGLLLAVPITAAIKAVCERVEDLQVYAELLKA